MAGLSLFALAFLSMLVGTMQMQGASPDNSGIHSVSTTKKYLISSFPTIKTVAYTHLPDTVWRPLFVGTVSNPQGVVVDPQHARLFVADTDLKKIFVYNLIIEDDGLLKTDGQQHVAVEGVTAYWMAVNGLGDLYFSGEMIVKPPASSYRSVYRMDNSKIATGDALNPFEVYSRSNSGFPSPAAWLPSGVGVDSFNVYWGNEENGKTNGAVCSGTRQNIGVTSALHVNIFSKAVSEVRGMALTGESIFYLSPDGVYGIAKADANDIKDAKVGLIQGMANSDGWDPKSMAFDGEGTMYYTEAKAGIIYQFPAGDTNSHPHKKYVDAPEVYGVTVFSLAGGGSKKPLVASYGLPQSSSSARADESAARLASDPRLPLALLAALAALLAC